MPPLTCTDIHTNQNKTHTHHMHTQTCTHTHAQTHVPPLICAHTCTRPHSHAHTHMHTHAHVPTHMHTHTTDTQIFLCINLYFRIEQSLKNWIGCFKKDSESNSIFACFPIPKPTAMLHQNFWCSPLGKKVGVKNRTKHAYVKLSPSSNPVVHSPSFCCVISVFHMAGTRPTILSTSQGGSARAGATNIQLVRTVLSQQGGVTARQQAGTGLYSLPFQQLRGKPDESIVLVKSAEQ